MSRTERRERERAKGRSKAAPAGVAARRVSTRVSRRTALAAGLVLALAVAAFGAWAPWRARAPRTARVADTGTPADALDLRAAYTEAARLYQADQNLESLPYFRRVSALVGSPSRNLHMQMADALERAALQSRRDAPLPASRSSVERVALVREALEHLDAAERRSRTPRELAEVRAWRANILRVWGFPWETLAQLRAAVAADSSWLTLSGAANLYARRLRYPDESLPGVDADLIPRAAPAPASR